MARVPRKLTIAEASELTGLSRKALARRVERGALNATTDNGLRYLDSRELARAGLLDLAKGEPAAWSGRRVDPDSVARELVQTLIEQSVELHELRERLGALEADSRRGDEAIHAKMKQMDADRADLRSQLAQAKRERAALRGQIEQKTKRRQS